MSTTSVAPLEDQAAEIARRFGLREDGQFGIEVTRIVRVLLVDGWHSVDRDPHGIAVFIVGTNKFLYGRDQIFNGAVYGNTANVAFAFREEGIMIKGPVTSILAVQTDE